MTINAVQQHVLDLVNGVQPTIYYPEPIQAFIRPLTPGILSATAPQVFIWGSTGHESRYTPPRGTIGGPLGAGAGYRRADYKLRMWLIAVSENVSEAEDPSSLIPPAFPALIWQVMDLLRQDTMPAELIDPQTGAETEMILIGEEFDWDYDVDRTLADQRYMRSVCLLECPITEMWQE